MLRHIGHFGAMRVLDNGQATPILYILQPFGPVGITARKKETDHARPRYIRAGPEGYVDTGPAEMDTFRIIKGKTVVFLQQHMIVRGTDIHGAR